MCSNGMIFQLNNMTSIALIIQARMGSTRFPGKMLASLGNHLLLEWVIHRVKRTVLISNVILATSTSNRDTPLVNLANSLGIEVYRGSEVDVLSRFALCAEKHEADTVVRVCADNPFVDPHEIDRLIKFYKSNPCDYACNHQERFMNKYADGFGAEIFSNESLQYIAKNATLDSHREHLTLFFWDNPDTFHLTAVPCPHYLAYPELRFDVDNPSDLAYLSKLTDFGVNIDSSAKYIINIARTI